jgi:hypothetical protein
MKIQYNLAISAVVAIVFVTFMVNAHSIYPWPVSNNQSRLEKFSVSDLNLPLSHTDNAVKSTTEDTRIVTLIPPTFMENVNKVSQNSLANNQSRPETFNVKQSSDLNLPISHTDNAVKSTTEDTRIVTLIPPSAYAITSYTKSNEEATDQPTVIEPAAEYFPDSFDLVKPGTLIDIKKFSCQDGYTANSNGGCEKNFSD